MKNKSHWKLAAVVMFILVVSGYVLVKSFENMEAPTTVKFPPFATR